VYSENAVDVFDVNTMEWIQTIPLKKVSVRWEFATAEDSAAENVTGGALGLHLVDETIEFFGLQQLSYLFYLINCHRNMNRNPYVY